MATIRRKHGTKIYGIMCSILGGTKFDINGLSIFNTSKDRGRDFTGLCQRQDLWIANHRATPTNELEDPIENQPLGKNVKLVHNGTIANDDELGYQEGAIDSSVLTTALDFDSLLAFANSFQKIKGSYAVAALVENDIWLACNYKPIFIGTSDGEWYFSSLKHHLEHLDHVRRMPPYSVMSLLTGETVEIERMQHHNRALVICSGGLDSTAVAGYVAKMHEHTCLLHFDYGCKATKAEVQAIKKIAQYLSTEYKILSLKSEIFGNNSTLFQEDFIDTGKAGVEYALDWVPARNLVMLSLATAYAEANDYGYIYLGTNLEEAGAYPDNEEQFIRDFDSLLYGAVNEGLRISVETPLGGLMKREIVEFGTAHGSPLHLSYSCYNGDDVHCGKCGPCYMRKKAFKRAGIEDPTKYQYDGDN